jgi:3-dehydroquinate dehydratase II
MPAKPDQPLPLVFVLNGPNLNLLGEREPEIYGTATLADIKALCERWAEPLGLAIDFRQSNAEGTLVDWIQEGRTCAAGFVLNAGAYTHTSIAIRDALLAVQAPVIEVHLSNIFKREGFRHHSFVSGAAQGMICGFGVDGYRLALEALAAQFRK